MRKNNTNEQLHTQPQFHLKPVYAAVLLAFTVQTVQANPTDATVVSGQASFNTTGSTLTVTNTPGTIIHWQGFSIGANEITRFAQQSASSAVLNRVVSNNPSSILGTLQSNGRVFLINPNGIVFGAGSTVDVAGLVASTLNLSNADFLAGRYSFTEVPGAQKISNAGNIASQGDGLHGGQIYLIAPDVENTGVITAPNGEILLVAGHSVDLVNTNSPNLIVNITAPAGDATNVGQLIASSGSLGLFGTVVRNSGQVSADSATMQGGRIVFKASQRAEVGGTVSATGTTGGTIEALSSNEVQITAGAALDASGTNGGGTVLVGGDKQGANPNVPNAQNTYVDATATIKADATQNGDGGKVIVWADSITRAYGSISAQGGANGGNGGFVETSAHYLDVAGIRVDASARHGDAGMWLLDPADVSIDAVTQSGGAFTGNTWVPSAATSYVNNGTIEAILNGGTSVTITIVGAFSGEGDIKVNTNITQTGVANNTLILQAVNNILVRAGKSISSTGGALNVVLNADKDGAGGGGIYLDAGSSIISNGGNITLGGGLAGDGTGFAIGNGTNTGGNIFNSGIYVLGDITAGAGNVTMRGQGASGSVSADGITFAGGTLSSNGIVNIEGTANAVSYPNYVAGVHFANAGTRLSTATGTVTVTGTNLIGGYSPRAQGVTVENATIETTGSGTLTLIGSTQTATVDTNWGVGIVGGTVRTTATSGGGALTLIGTAPAGDGAIVLAGGNVTSDSGEIRMLSPSTGGIGILGGSVGGGGSGNILMKVSNPSSIIDLASGSINAGASALTLSLAGGTASDHSNPITASSLRLLGTGTFNLGGSGNNAGTLAANVTGNVAYKDSNGFIIGSVTSFDGTATTTTTGVTTNNSNFTGTTTVGDITLNVGSAINTGKGALNLSATGGNLNINGDVSAGTFTLSGGTWNQVSATLPGFTVNDFRITGGTFIRALSGDGTITPYQLADIYGVQGIGSAGMLGYSYELANDINAAGTLNWNAGAGFVPVGNVTTSFTGQFDGLGYTISNLVINRPTTSYVGLFGYAVGSSIMNVGLVNSSVTGGSDVGALAGYSSGTIGNSYVSGAAVLGNSSVGGLAGYNFGSISNSYVSGGSVTGSSKVGGLVGHNGLTTTIINSYSTGKVTGSVNVGGLVGTNSGTITDSYWDITTSGHATSAGGTGLTTTQMMIQASYTGFDFNNTWWMIDGNTRPFLRSEWSTNITNAHQLQLAGMDATTLAATYTLKNDIDLAPALAAGGMWSSSGFAPIGNATTSFTGTFDGLGHTISNLTINRPATNDIGLFGVTGAASSISNVGLDLASVSGFDRVGALVGNANGGITNSYASGNVTGSYWVGGLLGIVNATITDVYSTGTVSGLSSVGGMAGSSGFSTISSSYSTSNVSATGVAQSVGGFVGDATWSTISNSYSTGSVVGSSSVGGFAGVMQSGGNGSISNSYSIGAVTGTTNVGGFVGINAGSGAITNSFWDITTSGQATSAGGTGLTTALMMTQASYPPSTGQWDFTNTWYMIEGNTRPFLRSEWSTTITNAHQLQLMAMDATTLSASYTLGANIDAAETALGIGMWSSAGFLPIGDPFAPPYGFSGKLDGQGHTISNLSINSAGGDAGLFGVVGVSGIVGNVGLINSNVVAAGSAVGGLAGNNAGSISNSYVSNGFVNVTGAYSSVGGLVGSNSGTINNSHVRNSNVHGEYSKLGGLAGSNSASGNVNNSYVSGGSVVSAASWPAPVGGLVGDNAGAISNTYVNGGTVASLASGAVGGMVGNNSGSISTSYVSSGSLTSVGGPVGGLVGGNNGSVSNSFWDTATTGIILAAGSGTGPLTNVSGLTTAQTMSTASVTAAGFNLTTTWWMSNTNTRPFLQSEYSPTITNSHQLQLMAMDLGASYTLGANIDASETAMGTGMWSSAGFLEVGDESPGIAFTGQLDGKGFTINGLTINRPAKAGVGLFGRLGAGAVVSNVGLVGGSVTGWYRAGGLAGYNAGSISNTYVSGMAVSEAGMSTLGGLVGQNGFGGSISNSYVDSGIVTGSGLWVGGLAGLNDGSIDNSHVINTTVAVVISGNSVGGLVGWNTSGALVSNSYVSNGGVSGNNYVGGLVGWNSGTVNGSNTSNGSVTGSFNVGGLVGWNSGSIDSSSVSSISSNVTGNNSVGGLVGNNSGTISNGYVSSGMVWGLNVSSTNLGGLAGANTGVLTNSHYNIDVVSIQDGNHVTLGGLFGVQYLDWYGTGVLATGGLNLNIADYSSTLSGSAGNYTISNVQGMKDMLGFADTAGLTFTLTAPVVLPSNYCVPELKANFNGGALAGNTLSSLNINLPNDNLGLFGHIALGSTVSNVALLNASVTGHNNAGALAGLNEGAISNSHVSGANVSGVSYVGGLTGYNYGIVDNSSVSNSTVSASGSNAGGLVGYNWDSTITGGVISNSHVSGGSVTGATNVGGLAGSNDGGEGGAASISNSFVNNGAIVTGSSRVGGLVGYCSNSTISNSYVSGSTVSGSGDVGGLVGFYSSPLSINSLIDGSSVVNTTVSGGLNVGGLVGQNSVTISNSYVSGGSVSGIGMVGGLAGYSSGSISNSYVNGGSVLATQTAGLTANAGGLVGYNAGSIINSYASNGSLSGGSAGGVVGTNNYGSVTNSFWDTTTVGAGLFGIGYDTATLGGTNSGAAGLNTIGMMTMANFTIAGWSIANTGGSVATWRIYEGNTTPLLSSFLTPLTATANNATKTYDGNAFSGGNGVGYSVTPTLTILGSSTLAYGGTSQGAVNAGGYTITASGLYSDQLGYDISYVDGALAVNPYAVSMTGSRTYDGTSNVAAGIFTLGPLVGAETLTLGGSGSVSSANVSAGSQTVTLGTLALGNGTGLASNYTFTGGIQAAAINPATLTYTANAANRLYGAANPALSGSVGGFVLGESLATATTGSETYTTTATGTSNVGSYAITGSGLTANNGNYTFVQAAGNSSAFTINPATLTYTANVASRLYGAANPAFSGSVGGFVLGESLATATTGSETYTTTATGTSNVGSYAITGSGLTANNGNYNFVQAAGNSSAFTINAATLTYTANAANRLYGAADPAFSGSVSGFVLGDTLVSATTGAATFSTTALNTSNVGSYAINGAGLTANFGNYTFVQAAANSTAFTINPALLTVTANNASKIYDTVAYSGGNGVSYTGFVNSETSVVLGGALTYGGTSQGAVNVGSYLITPGGFTSGNYTIGYVDGILTIDPATLSLLSVTANDASKTYGTTLTFNGSEFTPVGLLGGDIISGVTLASAGAVNTANAGTYAITPSNAVFGSGSASNYTLSYVDGQLTVTARPINVTANAISKVYGDADPALTYAVGGLGLTSWDTNATAFTGALARAAGENVAASPYAISQGTLTASNYTITFAGNVFSITPAPLSVYAFPTNKIISTPDPLLTYMVSGLKLGDTAAATLNSGLLARDAGEAVGNYQINQGSLALASSNYTMSYFPASFTILAPTVVDEIANAILLLGTPETGSAQSTSSSDEEKKPKAEEEVVAPGTPASGDTTTPPLPVCPGA